jgi:hypothetical protein
MGMLTDFFVASADDAARYDEIVNNGEWEEEESSALPLLERVEHRGFTGIELSALWALIEGMECSSKHMLSTGPVSEESEAIVERFPQPFVELLEALSDSQINELSSSWAGAEGIQHDAEELVDILSDLRRLARKATSSGKNLYIWYAL